MLFAELRVPLGSTAIMPCSATDAEWRKGYVKIYSHGEFFPRFSSRYSVMKDAGSQCDLVIPNVSLEDEDTYFCFGVNGTKEYRLKAFEGILAVFSIMHIYI